MKTRSSQSGSVASFIIIGVIFVLVAGGLLYWARHSTSPAPETPVVTLPGPQKTDDSNKPDTNETKPEDSSSSTPSTSQPETTTAPQAGVDQLSHTGPTETSLQLLVLSVLAGVVVAFVRSRNLRSSL
ncbi:MAG: hypothetical protein JWO61_169 [Candidatus Saccharibacteria bacterium]|nr:hypothetical protein [Candidatus Saccharibacteria bacterium]